MSENVTSIVANSKHVDTNQALRFSEIGNRRKKAKTNDKAGDGTTSSTLLAYEIVKGGMKALEKGVNPMSLKKGVDIAVEKVVKEFQK